MAPGSAAGQADSFLIFNQEQSEVKKMELVLRLASAEDAPVIWKMQKIAFRELLERYQDYDISPVNQSLDQLRLRCSQKDRYYYFINVDENPVGVLSVTDKQDGSR